MSHLNFICIYRPFHCTSGWTVEILNLRGFHYSDVIMGVIAFQITSLTIFHSTVYSDADQRKHQSSASSLAFVENSPVTGEFPAQKASNVENVSIWWRHHINTRPHPSLGAPSIITCDKWQTFCCHVSRWIRWQLLNGENLIIIIRCPKTMIMVTSEQCKPDSLLCISDWKDFSKYDYFLTVFYSSFGILMKYKPNRDVESDNLKYPDRVRLDDIIQFLSQNIS